MLGVVVVHAWPGGRARHPQTADVDRRAHPADAVDVDPRGRHRRTRRPCHQRRCATAFGDRRGRHDAAGVCSRGGGVVGGDGVARLDPPPRRHRDVRAGRNRDRSVRPRCSTRSNWSAGGGGAVGRNADLGSRLGRHRQGLPCRGPCCRRGGRRRRCRRTRVDLRGPLAGLHLTFYGPRPADRDHWCDRGQRRPVGVGIAVRAGLRRVSHVPVPAHCATHRAGVGSRAGAGGTLRARPHLASVQSVAGGPGCDVRTVRGAFV